MTLKEKIARGRIRTPTLKDLHICSPVIYHCATLAWVLKVSILVYKSSTLKNNTFFEMSISRKTNKILELFQSAYVVLLIKKHTCKVHLDFIYKKLLIYFDFSYQTQHPLYEVIEHTF